MPRCSIRHCKARKLKILPKLLTLHKIPASGLIRKRWLDAISIDNLNPQHNTWFVCSMHFDEKCYNTTASMDSNRVKLRTNAVPSLLIEAPKDRQTQKVLTQRKKKQSREFKDAVCRVCLASDRRVYSLRALGLAATYNALSGAALRAGGPLPQGACAACALRLRAAHRLAEGSRRASELLTRLLETWSKITPEALNELDLDDPALAASNLVPALSEPDRCDLHIIADDGQCVKEEERKEIIKEETDNVEGRRMADDDGEVVGFVSIEKTDDYCSDDEIEDDQTTLGEGTNYFFPETEQNFNEETEPNFAKETEPKFAKETEGNFAKETEGNFARQKEGNFAKEAEGNSAEEKKHKCATETVPIFCKETEANITIRTERNFTKEPEGNFAKETKQNIPKETNQDFAIETNQNLTKEMAPNIAKVASRNFAKESEPIFPGDAAKDQPRDLDLLEQYFEMQRLSLREQLLEHGKAKLKSNYLKSRFKCDLCAKGFARKATFGAHMTKHDKSKGDWECPVCHIRMQTRSSQLNHFACHDSLYTCKECAWTTKHRYTAILHARWHRGAVYKCDLCVADVTFTRPTSLLSHLRLSHPGTCHCPLCGYSFLGEKGLKHHIVLKHADETLPTEGPRCDECKVTFATDDVFYKHQKVIHERCERNRLNQPLEKRRNARPRAGIKVADRARNTKTAVGVDGGGTEDSFPCPACGESHATQVELQRHTRAAHGCSATRRAGAGTGKVAVAGTGNVAVAGAASKALALSSQCHLCGRLFKCAAVLKDHLDSHTGLATHACPECGKLFKTRAHMRMHRRGHTARYTCPICRREFNSSSNRDRHYTYVHSTVRDIKCEFCDKTFKSMECRRLHEKYVHLETPWPKRKRARKAAQVES